MKRLITLLFVALTVCLASTAFAQENAPAATTSSSAGNGFGEGAMSLSLGVPGGGNPYANGTFGIWYGVSGNMNLGVNVGLGIDTAPADTVFNLLLAPALKYYMMPGAEVTPFILGQLNIGYSSVPEDDNLTLSVLGGFGAEWFITPVFSLAGYTGLGIDLLRGPGVDPLRVGTLTSGFSAQIYW